MLPERPAAFADRVLEAEHVDAGSVDRQPAVVAPVGFTRSGLPVGFQIIGPLFEDRTAIDVARQLADLIGGFTPPPALLTAAGRPGN